MTDSELPFRIPIKRIILWAKENNYPVNEDGGGVPEGTLRAYIQANPEHGT